jgi:dTDP-4-amino-4,6-dideoxygalactose transaminase
MHVPFMDIKAQNRAIRSELQAALEAVIEDAQFILGPAVERFEQAFAQYIGAKYCVGLNSGTTALHLALFALDIGPGDEVITTPHTWISTSWAISYVGAKPVYVDISPTTYTIDPQQVAQAITARTKAILPVHLYGHACEMTALCDIAEHNNLFVIEDVAQAHGARHAGRGLGSIGKIGCFSFYPGKNLGAFGEAGCIVTDDPQIDARIRRLRDHAQDGRHHHVEIGYNARMEGVQGAVLEAKLQHLTRWNASRSCIAEIYKKRLADVPGIQLPVTVDSDSHVWHLYVILSREVDRDELKQQLQQQGIATAVHYPTPVHLQPAYAHLGYCAGDLPVAEDVARHCLSLPMYPEMERDQVELVARAVREACKTGRSGRSRAA